jgi:hypothetical protein
MREIQTGSKKTVPGKPRRPIRHLAIIILLCLIAGEGALIGGSMVWDRLASAPPTHSPAARRMPTTTSPFSLSQTISPTLLPSPKATDAVGRNYWTNHGPEGGNVNALTIDPTMPTTLYAGTEGGAYKSTDGGET